MRHDRMQEFEREQSLAYGGPAIGAWPRRKGERLRPHKGGGGGDGGARQMEAERQARVKAATDEINAIFGNKVRVERERTVPTTEQVSVTDAFGNVSLVPVVKSVTQKYYDWVEGDPAKSRDNLYKEQRDAVYDLNSREVERQAQLAERKNRFGLARAGQLGGSLDIDSNAEIGRVTNEGLLQAGGLADQSAAELKSADERTRANLISMAQSGIDTGSAATMALQGLDANARTSAAQRSGASIGQLFSDLGQAYYQNQVNQGTRAGSGMQPQWFGVSDTRTGFGGRT